MNINIDLSRQNKTVKEILINELKLSRGQICRLKQQPNGITVDGKSVTVRYVLSRGQVLSLGTEDRAEDINENIKPVKLNVEILYEDENIICVNKPAGMTTHPSYNHHEDTLANALAYIFMERGVPFVFRAVNRLDRETSGVLLVAKNRRAAGYLGEEMKKGRFAKEYKAILKGVMEKENDLVKNYIKRRSGSILFRCAESTGDESEYSETEYSLISKSEDMCCVKVMPKTGRTHQIRVTFSSLGCPVYGDGLYGNEAPEGLMLHASSLEFSLMSGKRLRVEAPVPERFYQVYKEEI